MREAELRSILSRLGIQVASTTRKTKGVWLNFRCALAPWTHARGTDRHPSAGAMAEEGGISSWHCQACKRHGRVGGLIEALAHFRIGEEGHDPAHYQKLKDEADMADMLGLPDRPFEELPQLNDPLPEPLIEEMYEGVYPPAWDVPVARAYLEARGISGATAGSLGLQFRESFQTQQGKTIVRNDIIFPVRDRAGNLYGWTGRTTLPNPEVKIMDYEGLPKRHLILGEERWIDGRPLLLVEGLFAYAHLVEIGAERFTNVGALLGSLVTDEKAERIRLFNAPTYLGLDNDPAGEAGIFGKVDQQTGEVDESRSAIKLLAEHVPLFIPEWPDGKIDPDELTIEEVESWIKHTPPMPIQKR